MKENGWISLVKKKSQGDLHLYATTKYFLDDFGLKSLSQLPEYKELENSDLNLSNNEENPLESPQEVSNLNHSRIIYFGPKKN